MKYTHNNAEYLFSRYPVTTNKSLVPFSAADEYIMNWLAENDIDPAGAALYNDRFGFLTSLLIRKRPLTVIEYASQAKAVNINLSDNHLTQIAERFVTVTDPLPDTTSLGIIRIPKSLDLFEYHLHHLCSSLADDGMAVCGFMTRHFSKQMVSLAEKYFGDVQQSLAWKKARLIICKNKKELPVYDPVSSWEDRGLSVKQYPGVFAARGIDPATRLLLDKMYLRTPDRTVLDAGCGSGVIAMTVRKKHPEVKLHLLDDSYLAAASAKLNLEGDNTEVHTGDTTQQFKPGTFNLALSNPPVHFGHENNIEVALSLFADIHRCLDPHGRFIMVSGRHLNLKTHLVKIYPKVNILGSDDKNIVYECWKEDRS